MIRRRTIYSFMILAILASTSSVLAAAPTLKEIMQGLQDDLVQVLDGLLVDDPDRIAIAAHRIADHPTISVDDRQRIAAELQEEMAGFVGFDRRVHALSLSIEETARKKDLTRIRKEVYEVIDSCLACHSAYKDRIAESLSRADDVRM